MQPENMLRVDLQGPHAQAAAEAATAVLQQIGALEVEVLLAASFLTGLRAGIIHFATFMYFARKAGNMMVWPCSLPTGDVVPDLYAPFTASAADRYPADAYGEGGEFPAIAAKYLIN